MRAGVFPAEIMRVVRGHQRNPRIARQADAERHHALVGVEAVVLKLDEKVALPENVLVAVGQPLGVVVAVLEQGLLDIALQAGRQCDQALRVARQQVFVDARLIVKPFEVGGGNQVNQVAVAFLVFAQEDEVVVAVAVVPDFVPLLRDIDLASEDRSDAFLLGGGVELHGAEQVAVIGQRDRRHALLGHGLDQLVDFARSIQQRIVGVEMQVDKRRFGHRWGLKNHSSTREQRA